MRILIVSSQRGYGCDKVRLIRGDLALARGNLEKLFETPRGQEAMPWNSVLLECYMEIRATGQGD